MSTTACEQGAAKCDSSLNKDWIAIKMDDRVFVVMRSTLLWAKDTMFSALFAEEGDDEENGPCSGGPKNFFVVRDPTHPLKPFLFDRNPRYFEPVLNYLRTGELILDPGVNPQGVLVEAQYFGVQAVVDQLESSLQQGRSQKGSLSCSRAELEKALMTTKGQGGLLRLQGLNFEGFDFSNMDLSGLNFSKSNLSCASFKGATLDGASLKGCVADEADFTSCSCYKTDFSDCDLTDAIFESSNCSHAEFRRAKCHGAKFICANLVHIQLQGADLTNADLTGARLNGAQLDGACLTGADRSGTSLTSGGVLRGDGH